MIQIVPKYDITLNEYLVISRASSFHSIIGIVLFTLPLIVLLIVRPDDFPPFIYVGCSLAALMALIPVNTLKRSLSKENNWLLAKKDSVLLCKFRSYLNPNLPQNDPQILVIPFNEIKSLSLLEQKTTHTSSSNRTERRKELFLVLNFDSEIELQNIREALRRERSVKVDGKMRYLDFPVSVVKNTIRIQWRGKGAAQTPSLKWLLANQVFPVTISEMANADIDFTKKSDSCDMDDEIVRLVERGDSLAAIQIVQKRYKMNATEAKQFIDEL